ncbi:helix-turn-helix domain-containing protein [Rhizobium wuzhouense]|uniref:Helix-turn-helix domain-containing protein n=1 Tax=Rhizobium wuzhouense TaxID=1986026 RepID=A0ABX5NNW8_9HYPH|nr:helix-turn-helix domain-containing protein [Rhizobium wuzhouense]PYB71282.1 hypothetical protein DMY87_18155 [Rhizobium wuzhouense]
MSHDATNWAIKQRGIKPALKVVLWNLCDRYHPDNGCFPSQDTLAADCEVPRSTLNVYLDELEKKGLIAREQRRQKGSQKQERTRYYFPFEPDFERFSAQENSPENEAPSPETGHGQERRSVSRNAGEPSPENGESRVQNLDSNLVREPVREPVTEREGASAGLGQEEGSRPVDMSQILRRVKAMELGSRPAYSGTQWPGAAGSSTQWAAQWFAKLSDEERAEAERLRDAYLADCVRSGVKPVAIGVYFRDRKFEGVQVLAKDAAPRLPGGRVAVPVLGPIFAAACVAGVLRAPLRVQLPEDHRQRVLDTASRFPNPQRGRDYLAGKGIHLDQAGEPVFPPTFERDEERRLRMSDGYPMVKKLYEAARDRSAVTVEQRFEALKDAMEFVPLDSEMMQAWRRFYETNFLPFPPMGARGGYFPAGGPDALDEFRAKLATHEGEHDAA